MSDDSRLERIETKLDKLSEGFVLLARVEERQSNQQADLKRAFARIAAHDERLDAVERKAGYTAWTVGSGAKMLWALFTAGVGAVAAVIGRSFG